MATVNFAGKVSAQVAAGETVTLLVTKPDATIDTFTAPTLADDSFVFQTTYSVAGQYSVVVHVAADTEFDKADSTSVPFTISLVARTITVAVTVT